MTPQTSANLLAAIEAVVTATERHLSHELQSAEKQWLIKHYANTIQRRATKFITGAIEHADDGSFFHINFISAIADEIDDLDHYIGGLESHLAKRRAGGQNVS